MDDEILTLVQALKLLPIGDDKLRRMAKAKEIPCRKVGGRYLFIKSDVIAWIREGYTQTKVQSFTKETAPQTSASISKRYAELLGLHEKKMSKPSKRS